MILVYCTGVLQSPSGDNWTTKVLEYIHNLVVNQTCTVHVQVSVCSKNSSSPETNIVSFISVSITLFDNSLYRASQHAHR